jgi:hypothetical protein
MPSRDVVFMLSFPYDKDQTHTEYALRTWEYWCRRNRATLFVQREPLEDPRSMKPPWQRYHVFDILDRQGIDYDRVAYVDCDAMVRWDCPNFFDLAGTRMGVVRDNSPQWVFFDIKNCRDLFPDVELAWYDYFNSGVMVLNRRHRSFFRAVLDFYREHQAEILQRESLGGVMDQSSVNYLVRRHGIELELLPPVFNLLPLDKLLQGSLFVEMGYIWHFAGFPDAPRLACMRKTWERFSERYRDLDAGPAAVPSGETAGELVSDV